MWGCSHPLLDPFSRPMPRALGAEPSLTSGTECLLPGDPLLCACLLMSFTYSTLLLIVLCSAGGVGVSVPGGRTGWKDTLKGSEPVSYPHDPATGMCLITDPAQPSLPSFPGSQHQSIRVVTWTTPVCRMGGWKAAEAVCLARLLARPQVPGLQSAQAGSAWAFRL